MESALLFFLVGLSIFGAKYLVRNRHEKIQSLAFLGFGVLSASILGLFTQSSSSILYIPWGIFPFIGGAAGLIIYGADRFKLITRPGLQYVVTILLGLILAAVSYGFTMFYMTIMGRPVQNSEVNRTLLMSFVLIGFLTIFGYTFPERWFKQRQAKAKKYENEQDI